MGKVAKAIREILVKEHLEKIITGFNLMTSDTHIFAPTRIIYPDARVVVYGAKDPFAIFDKYAQVFGKALPLWQMVDGFRHFGHIGYHMYFARQRFQRRVVDKNGEPVVKNLDYQPAIPYQIKAVYEHNKVEISQWYLLDLITYTHTFGFAPMALKVEVECSLKTLDICIQRTTYKDVHSVTGKRSAVVSDPPQHERLNADWWKIWGQQQPFKHNSIHCFEYEGLVDGEQD